MVSHLVGSEAHAGDACAGSSPAPTAKNRGPLRQVFVAGVEWVALGMWEAHPVRGGTYLRGMRVRLAPSPPNVGVLGQLVALPGRNPGALRSIEGSNPSTPTIAWSSRSLVARTSVVLTGADQIRSRSLMAKALDCRSSRCRFESGRLRQQFFTP